jgi:pSer/pThr/pTyr-binding forkhead associated (FHA) protein
MKSINLGRAQENDIVLPYDYISAHHARITLHENGQIEIEDLNSTNGTFVNGNRIKNSFLQYNDIVKLSEFVIPWQTYVEDKPKENTSSNIIKTYTIGRNSENDIVIQNDLVSGFHACLYITSEQKAIIEDKQSTNGTYVNNAKVQKQLLNRHDQVRLAKSDFFWEPILASHRSSQAIFKEPKTRNKNTSIKILLWVLIGLIVSISTWFLLAHVIAPSENTIQVKPVDSLPSFSNLPELVQYAEQSVCVVDTRNAQGKTLCFGTGFFIDKAGIAITNAHVVREGSQWLIKTHNGEVHEVSEMIKINSVYDYAIFKVNDASDFTVLPRAATTPLKGEDIFVIGNPQGIESTLTKGIVSGFKGGTEKDIVNGTFKEGNSFIQIDVAISHGSSGSPVFNTKGEVVGIATLSFEEAQCKNCNFAVNIEMLKEDIDKLIRYNN